MYPSTLTTLAAQVIAILAPAVPHFSNADNDVATKVGEDAYAEANHLYSVISTRFTKEADGGKSSRLLQNFIEDPEEYASILENNLLRLLQADSDFAHVLSQIIKTVPFQEMSFGDESNITSNIFSASQRVVTRKAFQTHRVNHEKSANDLENLFSMINIHLDELDAVGNILAKTAQKLTFRSSWVKALVIILGALVATREVANQLIGASSSVNIVIYTIIGLLITAAAGLEAAFKWENRSAELRTLAATCRIAKRQSASQLTEVFAIETDQQKNW